MNRITTPNATATSLIITGMIALLSMVLPVVADAQDSQLAESTSQGEPMQRRLPFGRKRIDGVPNHPTRIISNTRSATSLDEPATQLYVLLPEEVAITAEAQPSLFWYLSKPVDRPIKLSISTPDSIEPILDLQLDAANRQGIQRLDLSKLPVRLKSAVRYDWVIHVASDASGATPDIYAKSVLWRIDRSDALTSRLVGAKNRRQRAAIAAQEGIWIDALAGISNLIEHKPNDSSLRRDRADLLQQVGFTVMIKPQGDKGYVEEVRFTEPIRLGYAK